MSKARDPNQPIGKLTKIKDFLPPPKRLKMDLPAKRPNKRLALQTNPSFWRMIEQRRKDRTIPLDELKRLTKRRQSF